MLRWLCFATFSLATVSAKTTSCSAQNTATGYGVLATFSSCSGLGSDDIMSLAAQIQSNKNLKSALWGKAEKCSRYPTNEEKQRCLAGFLNTMSANNLLTSDESLNNDDSSSKDIITTCGCLTSALADMPDCGVFSSFLELQGLLPTEKGVCSDLSEVCNSVSDLSKVCLDSDPNVQYKTSSCSAVEDIGDSCTNDAQVFWLTGTDGAEYCGLKTWQTKRLSNYYLSCPHYYTDSSSSGWGAYAYGTASGKKFVRGAALIFFACGLFVLFYIYKKRQGGSVGGFRQKYQPLGQDDFSKVTPGGAGLARATDDDPGNFTIA